jgi:hypothetical protein
MLPGPELFFGKKEEFIGNYFLAGNTGFKFPVLPARFNFVS